MVKVFVDRITEKADYINHILLQEYHERPSKQKAQLHMRSIVKAIVEIEECARQLKVAVIPRGFSDSDFIKGHLPEGLPDIGPDGRGLGAPPDEPGPPGNPAPPDNNP
jgi:hypothetical protein